MDANAAEWPAGTAVRIVGLAKTPQHNGNVGRVSARAGQDGRVGVDLGKGQTLSVRQANLERVVEPEPAAADGPKPAELEGVQRTLQRDNAVLQEFDGTDAPDTLVLYHHLRDRAFDAFNAAEYTEQMLRYYGSGIAVSEVVPRTIRDHGYLLVCMRNQVEDGVRGSGVVFGLGKGQRLGRGHPRPSPSPSPNSSPSPTPSPSPGLLVAGKVEEYNTLCEMAFQCQRQFCGISLLVKCRCFTCHRHKLHCMLSSLCTSSLLHVP